MKGFCKLLDVIYTVCLTVFVLSLIAMLLVQVVCLMNGPASVWIYDFIMPKAGVVAAVMVVAVVLLSYLRPNKKTND